MVRYLSVTTALTCWVCYLFAPVSAFASNTDTQVKCHPVVFAEYCFPGGSFHDLAPIERLEDQFIARAQELKGQRAIPSKLPEKRREELERTWRKALLVAFDYADKHALKLSSLNTPDPGRELGAAPQSRPFSFNGPFFRATFTKDANQVFRLSKPIQLYKNRLLQGWTNNKGQLPTDLSGQFESVMLPMMLLPSMLPGDGELTDLATIYNLPLIKPFADRFFDAGKKAGLNFKGIFGWEMVAALQMAFEEKIRERNRSLSPGIHFYAADDNTAGITTGSPQVLFTGELMLSDAAVSAFSSQELRLLMIHEAMHLARPNFFMLLSAADLIQRERFPELNSEQLAPQIANLLGRDVPGRRGNCPLDLVHDDELLTDYYVFYLFRKNPELIHAYHAFLKRLHAEFDPGHVSQMSYRVRLADIMVDYLTSGGKPKAHGAVQDKLIWDSIVATLVKRGPDYLKGEPIRMEHIWEEMAKRPALEHDTKLIRLFFEYYKQDAFLHDDASGNPDPNLSCRDIEKMLRSNELRE